MSRGGAGAPHVDRIDVAAFTVPTEEPEADGTLEWDSTTIVLVEVHGGGERGIGYSYTHAAAALLIRDVLAPLIRGGSAFDVPAAWSRMVRAVRNIGREGLASMAIAAVDTALWDLKARLLSLPLVSLLGRVRDEVAIYASGGFTSYSIPRLRAWLAHTAEALGARSHKIKVGADPDRDPERVRVAREVLGEDAELYVDANGAFTRQEALAMAATFAAANVTWFEEPVPSDDLEGLRWLRRRVPPGMAIAAGEYGSTPGYFRRMLQAGAVDVLMPDATRCAGLTGFLEAGALCRAFDMAMSAHTAPALHVHACCSLPAIRNLEWFHDHARLERMLFDGVSEPVRGMVSPATDRPGIGLELKRADAARFAA